MGIISTIHQDTELMLVILIGCTHQDKVCIKGDCINVEIADEIEEQTKGFMDRESLEENHGMLFVFKESKQYQFWMKDTLIPLDMIWINKEKHIVDITKNAQPCKEDPCENFSPIIPAKYVLEVNAGYSEKNNFKPGDKVLTPEQEAEVSKLLEESKAREAAEAQADAEAKDDEEKPGITMSLIDFENQSAERVAEVLSHRLSRWRSARTAPVRMPGWRWAPWVRGPSWWRRAPGR